MINPKGIVRNKLLNGLILLVIAGISVSGVSVSNVIAVEADQVESSKATSQDHENENLPGIDLAEGVTQLTGVAISPLLGVCSVGTWKYFHTPEARRHLLPWYCDPIFLVAGLVVLAICIFKDTLGAGAPPFIKKPLDLIELFEDKFSAAIATTAFVPFVS